MDAQTENNAVLTGSGLGELRAAAARRGIELRRGNESGHVAPYDNNPTMKRQLFWLSYTSRVLAKEKTRKALLDIGSNIPWLTGVAATHDVTMVDVRPHPLQDILPFRLIEANATSLPFENGSFDVVTFPQLLHWVGTGAYGDPIDINGDIRTIREVARVLKPGGAAIFTTFVVPGKTVLKIFGRRLFSLPDLKGIVADAGLEFIDFTIFDPSCREIGDREFASLSDKILMSGNRDEDSAWAIAVVKAPGRGLTAHNPEPSV